MASPVAVSVDSTGIHAPTYTDILNYLTAQYQSIYGSDVYLAADSQDGQFLAVLAKALSDCNQSAVAVYNAFSPQTAQGVGLSTMVKINNLARLSASNSTVNVTLAGVAGTTVTNGVVGDGTYKWNLPATVTIPSDGSTIVTATCQTAGAISAAVGAVNQILTPVAGWQTVTNASQASLGAPTEDDATLRQRQAASPALSSQTVMEGIVGALKALSGVTQVQAYENDTDVIDANNIPANAISFVVQGGDVTSIAQTILNKKTPGTPTYGTTTVTLTDSTGKARDINFFVPTLKRIIVQIQMHALDGYTSADATAIQQALADYVNSLAIGQKLMITRLYVPAQLAGASASTSFEIVSVLASVYPTAVGSSDILFGIMERATLDPSDVTILLV